VEINLRGGAGPLRETGGEIGSDERIVRERCGRRVTTYYRVIHKFACIGNVFGLTGL